MYVQGSPLTWVRDAEILSSYALPRSLDLGGCDDEDDNGDIADDDEVDTDLRHILTAADGTLRDAYTSCSETSQVPTWISESGKVILLGDAAHGMVPFLAQGAAQGIEDGACLAECLGRMEHLSDLPANVKAYETIRKPRAERVQKGTRDTSIIWHISDGPEQEARDRAFSYMAWEARDKRFEEELEKASPNGLSGKSFQRWLFGHDVFSDTNAALDQIFRLEREVLCSLERNHCRLGS